MSDEQAEIKQLVEACRDAQLHPVTLASIGSKQSLVVARAAAVHALQEGGIDEPTRFLKARGAL